MPSAFSAWTSAARMTSSGGRMVGCSGGRASRTAAPPPAPRPPPPAPATAEEASARVPECFASRSCNSLTDAISQAVAPSATAVRAMASSHREVRIGSRAFEDRGRASGADTGNSSGPAVDCAIPGETLAIPAGRARDFSRPPRGLEDAETGPRKARGPRGTPWTSHSILTAPPVDGGSPYRRLMPNPLNRPPSRLRPPGRLRRGVGRAGHERRPRTPEGSRSTGCRRRAAGRGGRAGGSGDARKAGAGPAARTAGSGRASNGADGDGDAVSARPGRDQPTRGRAVGGSGRAATATARSPGDSGSAPCPARPGPRGAAGFARPVVGLRCRVERRTLARGERGQPVAGGGVAGPSRRDAAASCFLERAWRVLGAATFLGRRIRPGQLGGYFWNDSAGFGASGLGQPQPGGNRRQHVGK